MNEITSTADMAAEEFDGFSEPEDARSDIVATHEPEGRGIEFHVSMRDYTMRDMGDLIIEAAARQIVGRHNERDLAKAIEAKCIELVDEKASKALAGVTAEIIDRPLTPSFGDKKPVTMREFIGLCGREYLTQRVDGSGTSSTSGYSTQPRIEWLVNKLLQNRFKQEVEAATNAAIREVQAALKAKQAEILAAETARIREALAKASV